MRNLICLITLAFSTFPAQAEDAVGMALHKCYTRVLEMDGDEYNGYRNVPQNQDLRKNYRIIFNSTLDNMRNSSEFDRFLLSTPSGLFKCPVCKPITHINECFNHLESVFYTDKKNRKQKTAKLRARIDLSDHNVEVHENLDIDISPFVSTSGVSHAEDAHVVEIAVSKKPAGNRKVLSLKCERTSDPKDINSFLWEGFNGPMENISGKFASSQKRLSYAERCQEQAKRTNQKNARPRSSGSSRYFNDSGCTQAIANSDPEKLKNNFEQDCLLAINGIKAQLDPAKIYQLKDFLEDLEKAAKKLGISPVADKSSVTPVAPR